MDTTKAITHIGLCAGYGGIELGLQRAIPDLRTVALCEIEAFAISNLVAKMEAGLMDPAPIWPNLKTFPWEAFRDRVDILTGGYPCQPFSAAGQRKGKQDPRHLWPWIADGIRLLRPRICFFENVEGHISLGLSDVIEDLAGMDYRTTWGIFSASEVGAPHQRKRVFILAVSSGFGGASGFSGQVQRHEGQSGESDDGGDQGMADTECGGLDAGQSQGSESKHCSAWPSRPGELANAPSAGHSADAGSICRSEGEAWRQDVLEPQHCGTTPWPSRPGEQQYGWEPPRVVADSHGIDRSAQAEGREHDRQAGQAGEAVADTGSIARGTSGRQLQSEQLEEGGRHSEATESGSGNNHGSAGPELGDASCEQYRGLQQPGVQSDAASAGHDMADTSFLGSDGRSDGSCRWSWESGEAGVNATGSGSQGDGMRQAEPPLGGNPDGPAGGLDYAQLCVSCDNRTDELRLLGNGVVPHTAELAFRVLIQELANE